MESCFIEFPKLGIHLDVNPIAFSLGTINVRWYGIIIASAIMIALTLAMKQSKRFGIKEDDLIDMFLVALPVSIVFARLFFVIFTWDNFKNDLLGMFRIWEGGIAIYGAIIGAILSVYIFSKVRKVNMLDLSDFAIVYLPIAQAIGRWGNFFNQELYGANTDLPWGMTGNIIQMIPDPGVDGTRLVHPTFLYESILNIIVFIILLKIRKNRKVKGTVLASYLMFYSFVRFNTEFLRVDEFGVGNIRYNQVFAAAVFVSSLIWMITLIKKGQKEEEGGEELSPSAYADVLETLNQEESETSSENIENANASEAENATENDKD